MDGYSATERDEAPTPATPRMSLESTLLSERSHMLCDSVATVDEVCRTGKLWRQRLDSCLAEAGCKGGGRGRLLTGIVSLFCELKISAMRKWRCLYNSETMLINYVSVHLL